MNPRRLKRVAIDTTCNNKGLLTLLKVGMVGPDPGRVTCNAQQTAVVREGEASQVGEREDERTGRWLEGELAANSPCSQAIKRHLLPV